MKITNGLAMQNSPNQTPQPQEKLISYDFDMISISGNTPPIPRIEVGIPAKSQRGENIALTPMAQHIAGHIAGTSGGTMVGGIPSATLAALSHDQLLEKLQNLESKGVVYYRKKPSWIPLFSDKRKQISASEAALTLESGTAEQKQSLEIKEKKTAYLPLRSKDDVLELEAFHTGSNLTCLPEAELARLLNDMRGLQYIFRAQGPDGRAKIETYGAYNILTGDWKEKLPFDREVSVESGGVTMAILTEEKAKDPIKIREELNEAKNAVSGLVKLHKDVTLTEIKLVGKPISSTTFSQRALFFIELFAQHNNLEDTKNTYRLVAESSKSLSEFEENSKTVIRLFQDLDNYNARQIQWSYNYIQQNLKGKENLKESFHRLLKATKDMNSAIQGLQFLQSPVGKEDFKTRENIFVSLVEKERDNAEAINDYQAIQQNMKEGETFQDAANELLAIMDGLEKRGESPVMARRGFIYLRQNLKDKKEQQESFRNIFRETGDIRDTIEFMEFLKNPIGSEDRKVREEVLMKILQNEKDTQFTLGDYIFVSKNIDPGENFLEAGTLFADLLGDLKDVDYSNKYAQIAYIYLHKNYKNDPDARNRFRNLYKQTRNIDRAAKAYSVLVKPVGKESYEEREKAYLKIYEQTRNPDEPLKNYEQIVSTLQEGESISEEANRFVIIAKTLTYQDKPPIEAYKDTKELFKGNPNGLQVFIELADAMKTFNETKDAYELLTKPVREETFEERKEIFLEILKESKIKNKINHDNNKREDAKEGLENFKTITTKLDKSETLRQGASRFKLLLQVLSGKDQSKNSRDAFTFIAEELEKGSFPRKTAREVTEELAEILLITDSLEMAKTQLLHPTTSGNRVIDEEDDFVIIGGVKLPVKKGQHR